MPSPTKLRDAAGGTKSNRFGIKSFFSQFSFVANIQIGVCSGNPRCAYCGVSPHPHPIFIDPARAEEVKVSRISPDVLESRPWERGETGSLVDINDSERIFLLGKTGNVLIEVDQSLDVHHNEAHRDPEYMENETVGEALLRLENPDDVFYAVKLRTGYEVENFRSVGGYSVTLLKPPRGFTLKGWVEEQLRRAKVHIEAKVAEIDAEA